MAEWAIRDAYLDPVNRKLFKTWLIHDKKQNKEKIKQKNPKQQQQQNCGEKKMQTSDLIEMICFCLCSGVNIKSS